MAYPKNPAVTAGPNGDGSRSLAKESRVGILLNTALTIGATGLLAWLQGLDTSHWAGWWSMVGVAAVSTGISLLTAWLKRNR